MKILDYELPNGKKFYHTYCDECMAELDATIVSGMWFLSCGHHLCANCESYGGRYNLKVHQDSCPNWSIGQDPSDDEPDDYEKKRRVQLDLTQRGFQVKEHF